MWNTHKAYHGFCEKKCQQQGNSVASIINSPARSPIAAPKVRSINTALATDARRSGARTYTRAGGERSHSCTLYIYLSPPSPRAPVGEECVLCMCIHQVEVSPAARALLYVLYTVCLSSRICAVRLQGQVILPASGRGSVSLSGGWPLSDQSQKKKKNTSQKVSDRSGDFSENAMRDADNK